jgi:thioredoxin-like negative regulator of GroEL
MFDHDLEEKYERARALYERGRFMQADALLLDIDRARPNHPDVLFGRALCLGKLGRVAEARVLVNKMQTMLNDPRAVRLRTWLAKLRPAADIAQFQ